MIDIASYDSIYRPETGRNRMTGGQCQENRVRMALQVSSAHFLPMPPLSPDPFSPRNDLYDSEEIYRDIVDHILEGIVIIQDGKVLYANPMACEISGYPRSTLEQVSLIELVHPQDRPIFREFERKRSQCEPTPSQYEIRIIDAEDETRWLTLGTQSLQWNGRSATLCFFSDITDNKRLEEELKHSLLEREAILQTAQVGISLTANRVHQ